MHSRSLRGLLVAVAAPAAGLVFATPVFAAVNYDPQTKAGHVDASNVRKAFGWTGKMLTARASAVAFQHDFWSDDNYSVACGGEPFPVVHHEAYGNFQLTDTVVLSRAAYHRTVTGFQISGAHSGISGTTVPPTVGQPCPEEGQGLTIDQARLVSSVSGWDLAASFGRVSHRLLTGQGAGASA